MNVFSTQNPVNAPVFIWGLDMSHGETAESLFDEVRTLTNNDFSLAVFDVTDWNAQFSPWTAPAVFGNFLPDYSPTNRCNKWRQI